jgi:uncharacterized membrane protein YfcA
VDPLVILFGFGVGILIGLTGIGGGSLMTPLLILFACVQPVVAIGTDLAYGAVTKTVGVPALAGLAFFVVHRSRARASVDGASERAREVAPA